jgi:hypothetical protein
MTVGIRVRDKTTKQITFDSTTDVPIFFYEEYKIIRQNVTNEDSRIFYFEKRYPELVGVRIFAQPAFNSGALGYNMPKIKVSYENGIPKINITLEKVQGGEGYLNQLFPPSVIVWVMGDYKGVQTSETHGLKAKNPSGDFVVSDTFSAYCFIEKRIVSFQGNQFPYSQVILTLTGYSERPLIFVEVSENEGKEASISQVVRRSNNTWDVVLVGRERTSTIIRVFGRIDDRYPNGSSEQLGIRIRSVNTKKVIWDSGIRLFRTRNTDRSVYKFNNFADSVNTGLRLPANTSVAFDFPALEHEYVYRQIGDENATTGYYPYDQHDTYRAWAFNKVGGYLHITKHVYNYTMESGFHRGGGDDGWYQEHKIYSLLCEYESPILTINNDDF